MKPSCGEKALDNATASWIRLRANSVRFRESSGVKPSFDSTGWQEPAVRTPADPSARHAPL